MISDNTPSRTPWRAVVLSIAVAAGGLIVSLPSRAQIGFPGEEYSPKTDEELDMSLEATIARGKSVYDENCTFCHRADGMGVPEAFPPLVAGAKFDGDENVIEPLRKLGLYEDGKMTLGTAEVQIDVVLNGIPGTRMFAFGEQLTAQETADVVTYIRNAWSNQSGELITREQVEAVAGK